MRRGQDAHGVRVVMVPGDRLVVLVRGPGVGVAGIAGEIGDGVAELFVAGPEEPDGPELAGLGGFQSPSQRACGSRGAPACGHFWRDRHVRFHVGFGLT